MKTHNDGMIDVNATSLVGYIHTTFAKLRATFGEPMEGDGYKTDAEWHVQFDDGSVAAIYNWKNGKAYLGDEGDSVLDIKSWNIGGRDKRVVELVGKALQ